VITNRYQGSDSPAPTSIAPSSPLYSLPHASAMHPLVAQTQPTPAICELSDSDDGTEQPVWARPELELFWTRRDWAKHVDKLKSITQKHGAVPIHMKMGWAIMKDGLPVTIMRHEEMRSYAREFWQDWLNKGIGPLKWGELDLTLASQFRGCMTARFPELQLCAGDWKTMEIGKQYYSAWLSEAGHRVALTASRECAGLPASIKDEDVAAKTPTGSEAEDNDDRVGPRK